MLAALALAILVGGGAALPVPAPMAVGVIPAEPGAFMLPEVPTYQAVGADLDDDGAREVVRLVAGERGSILVEAWREAAGAWATAGNPIEVIPRRPAVGQGDVAYAGTPARLLVRRAGGGDRLTLVRQPRFAEPDVERECCLLLHDLVLRDGSLSLLPVADPSDSVGAVSVLDMDGDGTDELLATRSLTPLGDISFPTEARLYRWTGEAFGPPVITQLPVGSGDSPFVLGDSDGLPGEEIGIISRAAGRPALFRISLAEGDALRVEDSRLLATEALAVPMGDGRGLAVIGPIVDLAVLRWPAGEAPGAPVAQLPLGEGRLIGAVTVLDEPRLLVRQTDPELLHVLGLPNLTPPRGGSVTRSPAAASFASSAVTPYVGPLRGGGVDGEPAVIYAGRLLPSDDLPDAPFRTLGAALTGTLAGAEPVGLVGEDRSWLAILHAPLPSGHLNPAGGRLDVPILQPGSGVSLAPLDVARTGERDDAVFEPMLEGATALPGGSLAVGASGFVTVVEAPPGSRIYLADADPSVLGGVQVVPESGRARVAVVPTTMGDANHGYRASLSVTTPAGHSYVASWDVRVLNAPPRLEAQVSTPFGSSAVEVRGRSAPYATVTVAGSQVAVAADGRFATTVSLPPWPTEVSVVAVDPVGNTASSTLTAVGLFDYRRLPWLPITALLVGAAAAILFLRVPRSRPAAPRAGDDAVLEEMDPD